MASQPDCFDEAYLKLAQQILAEQFEGELSSNEWRLLREALQTRLARLEEMAAEGIPAPTSREEIEIQLHALRQEELLARFVEEALAATLAFEDLRRQAEEGTEHGEP